MNDNPELPLPGQTSPASAQPDPEKKLKDRSPSYPAIGLRRALEMAGKLWEAEKRASTLVPRAMVATGFSAKSGHGVAALSAMKKFGLLTDEGSGAARKVKLTDTAIALLNPSTPNKEETIKKCALNPPIHKELWNKFGTDGGSEGTMRDYLTFERGFFEDGAKALIGQYKDTIAFAKLENTDKVDNSDELPEFEQPANLEKPLPPSLTSQNSLPPERKNTSLPPDPLPAAAAKQSQPALNSDIKYYPIPTDIGDAMIPMGMSEEDFVLLGEALKLFKKKIVRPEFPKLALWKNQDCDKEVMIAGFMGTQGGRGYWRSEEGTGIPDDELTFL